MFHEIHYLAFRPSPIVPIAIGLAHECAMTAVASFDVADVQIGGDALKCLRLHPNERIIRGMNDQGWHGDAVHHVGGRSALIIIICACETAVMRSHAIIEQSKTRHAAQPLYIEVVRKNLRLPAKTPEELHKEIPLINPVRG